MKQSRFLSLVVVFTLIAVPVIAGGPQKMVGPEATGPGLTKMQCCSYQVPFASFNFSQGSLLTYNFNASSSYDPDGTIVSYAWDFGDGNTATTSSPTISHQFGGDVYYVTLTVTDNHGFCNSTVRYVSTCGGYGQPHCPE